MTTKIGKDLKQLNVLVHHEFNKYLTEHPFPEIKQLESLSRASTDILLFLYEHKKKDIYQKDIENEFCVRKSTISSVLSTLENKELIQRINVETNKRVKKIILTEKALTLIKYLDKSYKYIDNKLTDNISQEELNSFKNTLNKIKLNLGGEIK